MGEGGVKDTGMGRGGEWERSRTAQMEGYSRGGGGVGEDSGQRAGEKNAFPGGISHH